eukprot:SAG11_NODE_28476_length_321_cov_0.828829_1_plen_98_part_01
MCRRLDGGEKIHRFDADVDCNSTIYAVFQVLAGVCMVIYPIGIPLGFGYLLFKNRAELKRDYSKDMDVETFALLTKKASQIAVPQTLVEESFRKADS